MHARQISAEVVCDSVSPHGIRLTTMSLCYPLVIHGEVMTHCRFSRNARSSRAVPVEKLIAEVRSDPWIPKHVQYNKPGMQGGDYLAADDYANFTRLWREGAHYAAHLAEDIMANTPVHKQIVNRILTPYLWMYTLVSATHWRNFYGLRRHKDAEPHMQELANAMHAAHAASKARPLFPGEWHLPFVDDATFLEGSRYALEHKSTPIEVLKKVSVARCARVSYKSFDGKVPSVAEDLKLYETKLMGQQPLHASPAQHQATPDERYNLSETGWTHPREHGNFTGWRQLRKMIPGEDGSGFACDIPGVL